jgi:hypothetical protein
VAARLLFPDGYQATWSDSEINRPRATQVKLDAAENIPLLDPLARSAMVEAVSHLQKGLSLLTGLARAGL